MRSTLRDSEYTEIMEEIDIQKSEELIMQLNNSQVNMRSKTPPLYQKKLDNIVKQRPESPILKTSINQQNKKNQQIECSSQQTILSTNTTTNNTKYSEKMNEDLWNTQEIFYTQNNIKKEEKYEIQQKIVEDGDESILTSENLAELSKKNTPQHNQNTQNKQNSPKNFTQKSKQNINDNNNNNIINNNNQTGDKDDNIQVFNNLIQSVNNLQTLHAYFDSNKIQLSVALEQYMMNINQLQLDFIDNHFQSPVLETQKIKKTVKNSIILERLLIPVIIITYLESKFWDSNIPALKNIIKYLQQNLYITIDFLQVKYQKQINQQEQISELIKNAQKQFPNIQKNRKNNSSVLKQNNEIILNLIKNVTKNDKELYSFIINYVKNSDKLTIRENYIVQFEYLAIFLTNYENINGFIGLPFLTVAPEPFLPPQNPKFIQKRKNQNNYSLILDLDETLIHYKQFPGNKGGQLQIRPYTQQFLSEMSQYYEIIIFTAAMEDYATWVVDTIDKNKFIENRLFRQHTVRNEISLIKDLSKIGRDLSKCIIVDNVAENFVKQPENGIFIKSWYDDPSDTALLDLGPLLIQIAEKNVSDVREALRQLNQQMVQNINNNVKQPHLNLKLE